MEGLKQSSVENARSEVRKVFIELAYNNNLRVSSLQKAKASYVLPSDCRLFLHARVNVYEVDGGINHCDNNEK